jgi:hypothetical protein
MRLFQVIAGLAVALTLSWAAPAIAQNESRPDEPDGTAAADPATPTEVPEELLEQRAIDEITVIAGPQGRTAYDMEMDRMAQMREAIYAEMRLREREQEDVAWRQADPDLEDPESRIKWGYSAQAEQRMRRENDFLYDMPFEQTKPASLLRVDF